MTPVYMEGDRGGSPEDGEMSERERDGVRQMYQTSTQSDISSPIPTSRRRFSGSDLSPIADSGGTNTRRVSLAPERPVDANRPPPGSVGGEMLSLEIVEPISRNGQGQLVSMARAPLRRYAVVIMDEATSSIDFETDAKIQLTVRQEFRASCLIMIAHWIRTAIDYDRLVRALTCTIFSEPIPTPDRTKERKRTRRKRLDTPVATVLESTFSPKKYFTTVRRPYDRSVTGRNVGRHVPDSTVIWVNVVDAHSWP